MTRTLLASICLLAPAWLALPDAFAAPPNAPDVRVAQPESDDAPDDADDADKAAMRKAKRHFDRGEKLFALRRFGPALKEYEAAYEAKPLPGLLFNIGQCHRNLGNYQSAVFSFRKYLREIPDAPNRAAVKKLIGELDEKIAEAEEAERRKRDARIVKPLPPPKRGGSPIYKRWWFWTGVVVTAAAAGTAAVVLTDSGGVPNSDLGNVDFGP